MDAVRDISTFITNMREVQQQHIDRIKLWVRVTVKVIAKGSGVQYFYFK